MSQSDIRKSVSQAYAEIAETGGYIELWEQRGPPDFCKKLDGEWVCE